jgi:hypothetical protein
MADPFKDYIPAKDAAVRIGISYELLMSRYYKEKIEGVKQGYAVFFHKDEVERERSEQLNRDRQKG